MDWNTKIQKKTLQLNIAFGTGRNGNEIGKR